MAYAYQAKRTMPLVIAVVGAAPADVEFVEAQIRAIWPHVVLITPDELEPTALTASVALVVGGTAPAREACARRGRGEVWHACRSTTRLSDAGGPQHGATRVVLVDGRPPHAAVGRALRAANQARCVTTRVVLGGAGGAG